MNAAHQTISTDGSGSCNSNQRKKPAKKSRDLGDLIRLEREALTNAVSGQSTMNYVAILEGFTAMGIALEDIKPRENIFTFHAWCAAGRCVKKGEHGVKVCTYVPTTVTDKETGEVKALRLPRQTTVFHFSQTEPLKTLVTTTPTGFGHCRTCRHPRGAIMSQQFGFDFEDTSTVFVEDAMGTWTEPRFTTEQYLAMFDAAQVALKGVFEAVRPLFELGLAKARAVHATMLRTHQRDEPYSLWRLGIQATADDVAVFSEHCPAMINGQWDSPGIEYKQRVSLHMYELAAYHCGVGSVILRQWAPNRFGVDFKLCKDSFFLPSFSEVNPPQKVPNAAFSGRCQSGKISQALDAVATVTLFALAGRQYLSVGGTFSNSTATCTAWSYCGKSDWQGPIYSYRSQVKAWDEGRKRRGDYRGLVVQVAGKLVVLDAQFEFFDDQPAPLVFDHLATEEAHDDGQDDDLGDDLGAELCDDDGGDAQVFCLARAKV